MRRYFKFLTTSLIACVLTIACVNELDLHQPINESEFYTTLVPRVEGFANQYITKSSDETSSEQKITKLAILVFNEDGTCIHLQESENGNPITLNKSMLNSPAQSGKLYQATVVMIANIGTDKIVKGEKTIKKNWSDLTFSDLENYSFQYDDAQTIITSLGDGFIGFPMIGASKVNLTSTKEQPAIEVKLKILYAKIKFAISVENGTENEGSGMSFTLNNYSVFNASKQTKLAVPTNQGEPTMSFEEFLLGQPVSESAQTATVSSATESASYVYNDPGKLGSAAGSVSVGGNPISFTFYVSESRFNHGLGVEQLAKIYPDGWTTTSEAEDVKDYTEEDKNKLNGVKYFYDELAQQYKPLLAQSASGKPAPGLATYVLLNGSYKDYRGEIWNVNYKVYLGKDNSQNFQVDRNSCYTNNIVIKGIRNNNDTDGRGEVWIDHRVDVEIGDANSAADHITITRETLIDSHIEVRPLRVQWPEGEYAGVRVYLPTNSNGTLVNWIGMERFTGDNCQESTTYCYDKNRKSTGKRRYFTTSLISELQSKEGEYGVQEDGNKKYIILLNGECAWIYFDEYVESSAQPREAEILLEFYPTDDTRSVETIRYQVKQKGLLKSNGGYFYESYEEYLHSYDSYDTYNLSTSPVDYTQQGLKWGYEGVSLSSDIIVSKNTLVLADISQGLYGNRYDFLVEGDSYDAWHMYRSGGILWDEIDYTEHSGKYFTDMVTEKKKVSIMDMGTMPESAYQYCLSKNKFTVDADENVSMEVHWYLPDVSEMQDILSTRSNSLYSDVYYWSSQPSFDEVQGLTSIFLNEKDSARAVSNLVEKPIDLPREHQHRIRCLYSPVGIQADMDGRTPDGIGGNHSFVMKAYLDKNRSGNGYFNYLIDNLSPEVKTTTEHPYKFDDNSYDYPKRSNSYPTKPDYGFQYVVTKDKAKDDFEGFEIDPDDKKNWNPNTIVNAFTEDDYYYSLAKYKGLSADSVRTLKQDASSLGNIINRIMDRIPGIDLNSLAREVDRTPKSDTLIEVKASTLQYDRDLETQPDLNLLLPYEDGGLSIRFSQQDGNEHPIYSFLEYRDGTRTTSFRNWIAPRYDPDTREMEAMSQDVDRGGSGEDRATSLRSMDEAKQLAFGGVLGIGGAYTKAQENAESNLEKELKKDEYKGWSRVGTITYTPTPLTYTSTDKVTIDDKEVQAVNYIDPKTEGSGRWWDPYEYSITCVVNLIATIQLTKPGSKTLYVQASGTGKWGEGKPDGGVPVPSVVETDQLKVFGGNSFTVKVSNPDYEITKVKVYYSESNFITEFATGDKAYVRFIDSSNYNQLPIDTDPSGMDYQDEEKGGIHQWSGPGRSEVTLVLVDYLDMTDYGNWFQKTYRYEKASKSLSKYLIIDKIEVKCTKKPEAGN